MSTDDFNNIECFFFDLDGTLLNISDQIFEQEYTKLLVNHFIDVFTPGEFLDYFMTSVEALMKHNDYENYVIESFLSKFSELSGMGRDDAWNRLHEFYSNNFGQLQKYVIESPVSKSLIKSLESRGKKIVLATNPVFPEIATRQRVKWANLDYENDFIFIPHISNSNAVKPDPQYYQNLLDIVNVPAEKILMVGNDFLYDGSASLVGIKTWIIDNNRSHLEYKDKLQIDYEGSLEDLLIRINSMDKLTGES
ncbi:MAG: Pyrophosphatase PpaX [Candidatus Heimdallarchaeota archaeon LC_2]|nr:MAG: Pyrophosphatase PpaX [Candidatus Heimdallarchaeota archaeon LC_2]